MEIHFDFDNQKLLGILKRSFFEKVVTLDNDNLYSIGSGTKSKIHPESFIFELRKKPKQLLYNQMIQTTNSYLNMVSEIN